MGRTVNRRTENRGSTVAKVQGTPDEIVKRGLQFSALLITTYIELLKEGRHENFNRVHSNAHRGQAGEHQKEDINRGLSQAVRKLADDGKDVS